MSKKPVGRHERQPIPRATSRRQAWVSQSPSSRSAPLRSASARQQAARRVPAGRGTAAPHLRPRLLPPRPTLGLEHSRHRHRKAAGLRAGGHVPPGEPAPGGRPGHGRSRDVFVGQAHRGDEPARRREDQPGCRHGLLGELASRRLTGHRGLPQCRPRLCHVVQRSLFAAGGTSGRGRARHSCGGRARVLSSPGPRRRRAGPRTPRPEHLGTPRPRHGRPSSRPDHHGAGSGRWQHSWRAGDTQLEAYRASVAAMAGAQCPIG